MKAKAPKMHYCPDCNREFHWLGWPRHRAMHRDRKTKAATTEEKNFQDETMKALGRALKSPIPAHATDCAGSLYPGGFCDC